MNWRLTTATTLAAILAFAAPVALGASSAARQIHDQLLELVTEGEAMQPYRGHDLNKARTCGQKMRASQRKVAALQQQADSLPSMDERIWLSTAIIHTDICCSCSDNALTDCKEAREELAHPERHVMN